MMRPGFVSKWVGGVDVLICSSRKRGGRRKGGE
jgi:hypothetical protein